MKNTNWVTLISILLWPAFMMAGEQKPEANVNERYTVESVVYSGIDESKISQSLRDEALKMVGAKYSEKTAKDIVQKIQKELDGRKQYFHIDLKVEKGSAPEKVKVAFQFKKRPFIFGAGAGGVYHSQEGASVNAGVSVEDRAYHNVIHFNLLTDSNTNLERFTGIKANYENQHVGTEKLHLLAEFGSYHEKWNAATQTALTLRPDVPAVYRARQNFSPSIWFQPLYEKYLELSAGFDFQRLDFQIPAIRTQKASIAYANVQANACNTEAKYVGCIYATYNIRTATRALDSDFVYTRHFTSALISFTKKRHYFAADASFGLITGNPPLFERFAFGNSFTLRGWNKFDVSPVGGTRVAHGSLEYRFWHLKAFYDVGTEWDENRYSPIRQALGFGIVDWPFKRMTFSLAFPLRTNNVKPAFGVF